MAVTPNYSWPVPVATDYVKDGWEAISDLGNAIDTTVAGLGSGLTLITSQTFTSAANVNVNNVFTSTYRNYLVLIDFNNTINFDLTWRFRASGADNTSNNYGYNWGYGSTAFSGGRTLSVSSAILHPNTGVPALAMALNVYAPQLASKSWFSGMGGADQLITWSTGSFNTTTQFDGFSLIGTLLTGILKVYGYEN